jgi:hypothetical protein
VESTVPGLAALSVKSVELTASDIVEIQNDVASASFWRQRD